MFDADQCIAALNPPQFKYQGRVYKGRVFSADQWVRFAPRLEAAARKQLDSVGYRVLIWELGRAMFPKPWWRFWERSVGSILLSLPPKVQEAALEDFLAAQGKALGFSSASPTPGNS